MFRFSELTGVESYQMFMFLSVFLAKNAKEDKVASVSFNIYQLSGIELS